MTPKMTIDKFGTKHWKLPNGTLHREGIPTLIWYDCVRHREGGSAVEYVDGDKYWYINGLRHREDGPAIEYASGTKHWCINGMYYTEKEYKCKMRSIKLKKLI
jgi:hypothetical protein